MGDKILVCRVDGIPVELTAAGRASRDKDKDFAIIGRGKPHHYKHTARRNDVGNPWCGHEALNEEDVESVEAASEA